MVGNQRIFLLAVCTVLVAVVSGCGSKSRYRPPIEDRQATATRIPAADPRGAAVKLPPGFENAGKAGYYTVKPGDTLIRVGLDSGQSYKDIARWNALEDPNKIEVGQVLRVVPPIATEVAVTKPVAAPAVTTTALPPAASATSSHTATTNASTANAPTASAAAAKPASTTKPQPVPTVATSTAPSTGPTAASTAAINKPQQATPEPSTSTAVNNDDDIGWIWPTKGPVLAHFEDPKNKGLDIGGTVGEPVVAAADGKVVYAGAGLRGYGNLVILKHNAIYLTAYAHNQSLAVKEDQTVKKGQKIAEMGSSDAERVKLHFEVRRQGKPVDPAKYLPAR